LLARLWELPGGELKKNESIRGALRHHLGTLESAVAKQEPIGALRHAITHRNIRAPVFLVQLAENKPKPLPAAGWRWIAPSQLHRYPVSSMTSKALKILAAHEKTSR
jgi:adenine-specific DNA glycosylase